MKPGESWQERFKSQSAMGKRFFHWHYTSTHPPDTPIGKALQAGPNTRSALEGRVLFCSSVASLWRRGRI